MSKRKYRKVLRAIDDALIRPLKGSDQKKIEQMYDNLWSQFGLDFETRQANAKKLAKQGKEPPCVSEWAWTNEAKESFYGHDEHKKFVRKLKRRGDMTWAMWVLQCEPGDYDRPESEEPSYCQQGVKRREG